jgi:hypothetical protein
MTSLTADKLMAEAEHAHRRQLPAERMTKGVCRHNMDAAERVPILPNEFQTESKPDDKAPKNGALFARKGPK